MDHERRIVDADIEVENGRITGLRKGKGEEPAPSGARG